MYKILILIIALMVSLSACSDDIATSSDSSSLHVTNVSVVSALTVERGESADVISLITPSNATNKKLNYSSSDENIASVDDNGTITGVAYGRAIITVASDDNPNIKRVVYIDVNNPVNEKCTTSQDGFEAVGNDWIIYDKRGLNAFRDNVTINKQLNLNGKLACDIELDKNISWLPIGVYPDGYNGTFDGDNYTISGLYIFNVRISGDITARGLFDVIDSNGVVKNVILKEPFIDEFNSGFVGGIAGENLGLIDNVSVIGGKISSNLGDGTWYVGGIAGSNNGMILSSSNSSAIRGYSYAGGIAGINEINGTIKASYNSGEITSVDNSRDTGGIAGLNGGEIIASYNVGNINSDASAGGIVGENVYRNTGGTIIGCYNAGQLDLNNANAGGIIGSNDNIYNGNLIVSDVSSSYYLQSSATKGIADAIGGDITGTTDNVSTIGGFASSTVINALNNSISSIYNYQYVRNEFEDAATRPLRVIAK